MKAEKKRINEKDEDEIQMKEVKWTQKFTKNKGEKKKKRWI